MFGRKTPEQPKDDFSLSHITDSDDVIESIRARRGAADIEKARLEEEALALLPPEERAHRIAYQTAMREMINENEDEDRRAGRFVSYRYAERPERTSLDFSFAQPIVFGTVALAAIFGPGIIADSGYGEEKAAHFLEEAGYTDVELTSKSQVFVGWQGCDSSDAVKYSFEATAVNGVDADVIVCKGIFKGATIRD